MSKEAFNYQLSILRDEINMINSAIRKFDDITQNIKKLTVTVWTGGMLFGLSLNEGLRDKLWFMAFIPLFFWPIDAYYRHTQRTFVYRVNQISKFLNSDEFTKSFRDNKLPSSFTVFDPKARISAKNEDYINFSSFRTTLLFRSVWLLYILLAIISIFVFAVVQITK